MDYVVMPGMLFLLFIGLTRTIASPNYLNDGDDPARRHLLTPRVLHEIGNYISFQQESLVCPTGGTECVGHCCVGQSCCAHGVVPCCLAG
jgi:hypothetical protein